MKRYEVKLTPRSERQAIIQGRIETTTEPPGTLWDFRGDKAVLPVVILGIDLPVYRMDNCRTYSEQQDAIAKNNLEKSYFGKGQELSTVQAVQHAILAKLAKRDSTSVSAIQDVLEKEGQRDPILITGTGVVVNGNRRLSAMRELYVEDQSPNSRWAYVKCMVLPADTSPEEVEDIEANEQARPQTKLDYDWIGDAQLVRRQLNRKGETALVAKQLRRTRTEVENLLQAIEEADLYLSEWAGKPNQYSLVSGDAEQIFGDLPKRLSGKTVPLQNASRVIAWSLFENRDKLSARVYAFNAAFGKLAEVVLTNVADQLNVTQVQATDSEDDADFSIDIHSGGVSEDYSGVIAALRNDDTKEEAVDALIEAAESAIVADRGKRSQGAALKALAQVHAKLAGLDLTTAGTGTYGAIGKQLDSIRDLIGKLDIRLAALKVSPSSPTDESA